MRLIDRLIQDATGASAELGAATSFVMRAADVGGAAGRPADGEGRCGGRYRLLPRPPLPALP